MDVAPSHVDYRRLQLAEQEHDALMCYEELEQCAVDKRNRLRLEHRRELVIASNST